MATPEHSLLRKCGVVTNNTICIIFFNQMFQEIISHSIGFIDIILLPLDYIQLFDATWLCNICKPIYWHMSIMPATDHMSITDRGHLVAVHSSLICH